METRMTPVGYGENLFKLVIPEKGETGRAIKVSFVDIRARNIIYVRSQKREGILPYLALTGN